MSKSFVYKANPEAVQRRAERWQREAAKEAPDSQQQRDDVLPQTDQENMISALAHKDELGRKLLQSLTPGLFEGDYKFVAERLFEYRKRYDRPPGVHTADLFSDILEDPQSKRRGTIHRILVSMLQLAEAMDENFVFDRVGKFIRRQKHKIFLPRMVNALNSGRDAEAERLLLEHIEGSTDGAGARLVTGDQFEMREIEWYMRPFFPFDMVSILSAEKGQGKTTIIADIAADLGKHGGHMVYISNESTPSLEFLPLVEAAGGAAARSKILLYGEPDAAGKMDYRPPTLLTPQELARLEGFIREHNEAGRPVECVVLEPLNSFILAAKASSDAGVRELLDRLALMAARLGVMVIVTTHWNKNTELRARDRIMGSVGVINAARSVNVIVNDPDEDGGKLLVNLLGNFVSPHENNARGYHTVQVRALRKIKWERRCDMFRMDEDEVDALVVRKAEAKKPGRPAKTDDCETELRRLLRNGPMPVRELKQKLNVLGYSDSTVDRVKARCDDDISTDVEDSVRYWLLNKARQKAGN
ncbi:AAA family ATPase [Mesorhizobium sp. B1-1-8]|uniref:AAA family ATPase n=1 Tax=Mesorhizobium sp. B1-1-8 TaxID=2589976 RepID=UPI0015E28E38|nr:AAA family ATPase [Mesorhizobium sp. B1-1-8]UCI09976.1 AAA family ATPase [Mesorhizobium sp. B1-1-8]